MHRFVSGRLLTLTAGLLVFQYSFSPFFFLTNGRPDFLYLLVLDYAFFWSWEGVPFFALGIGLLRDFVGAHLFGIETAALAATGLLLGLGIQKLERDNFWVRVGIGFLFVGLTETVSIGLGSWLEKSGGRSFSCLAGIGGTLLYTLMVSPVFFWFTSRWFKRFSHLKQYELF